ncbi:hypothetical protein BGZ63DRAFT_420289 [Mariannaea sp. PMI_226]|nr:hypothetical protein BGZ63DRAFT_420289 [Mariannaea sp. PMI_226]
MSAKNNHGNHAHIRASLLRYINNWEAWEAEHKAEASFSPAEWNALMVLVKRPFSQHTEDSMNYISPLFEQAHRIGPITKIEDEPFIDPVTSTARFRVSWELPGGRGRFPREGYGFEPGEEAPSFSKKMLTGGEKKAKQFAAKCALSFLDDNPNWTEGGASASADSSPDNEKISDRDEGVCLDLGDQTGKADLTHRVSPSRNPYLPKKKIKLDEVVQVQQRTRSTSTEPEEQPNIEVPRSPPPSVVLFFKSTCKSVEMLAKSMRFDVPKYETRLNEDGTYSGRPIFMLDGRMPTNLGVVSSARSEEECKGLMAQKVLSWLTEKKISLENDFELLERTGSGV